MKETECNICGSHYMWESQRIECEYQDYEESKLTNQVAQEVLVGNSYNVCSGCKHSVDDAIGCEWEYEDTAHYAGHYCYEFEQDREVILKLLKLALEAAKENEKIENRQH